MTLDVKFYVVGELSTFSDPDIKDKNAFLGDMSGVSPPLLTIVNSVSGTGEGLQLLTKLKMLLPSPHQVVDVMQAHPEKVYAVTRCLLMISFAQYKNAKDLRVLVCGGDGTAKMIIDAIEAAHWPNGAPPVPFYKFCPNFVELAICPLGTGNDLGRTLGWGGEADPIPSSIIDEVMAAKPVSVDRWKVSP